MFGAKDRLITYVRIEIGYDRSTAMEIAGDIPHNSNCSCGTVSW